MKKIMAANARGEVLVLTEAEKALQENALGIDTLLIAAAENVWQSVSGLSRLIGQIKQQDMWRYVVDEKHPVGFDSFDQYIMERLGKIRRTKIFEQVAIYELTTGAKPIPDAIIDELGQSKAYQLSRIPEERRTDDLVKQCLDAPFPKVKEIIQEIVNEGLPPDKRREVKVPLIEWCNASVVVFWNEFKTRAENFPGLAKDDVLTSAEKILMAVCVFFEAAHREEFAEIDREIAAKKVATDALLIQKNSPPSPPIDSYKDDPRY